MSESVSRALCEAYTAYPASWRRKRRAPEIDIWAASVALDWLAALKPRSVDMLDVGCGAEWLTERLSPYGPITGIDTSLLERSELVRALARGEYCADAALLPRYLTAGGALPTSAGGFGVALALGAPALPADFARFCGKIASVIIDGGWFVWNPPTHQAFNIANDWRACLDADFSILNIAHLTTPFAPQAMRAAEAIIVLARRNGR
ncbi:MAG: hypothetical protein JNM59_08580 [Hyphomonadaceae bacterium]|nr:hypothetical protein [Hyphomonadaceae bacterium]